MAEGVRGKQTCPSYPLPSVWSGCLAKGTPRQGIAPWPAQPGSDGQRGDAGAGMPGKLQEISFYTQIPSSQPNPNVSGVRQSRERDSPGEAKPGAALGTGLRCAAAVLHAAVHWASAWGLLSA